MLTKDKAIEVLQRRLSRIDDLASQSWSSPAFEKWKRETEIAIEKVFGQNTRHSTEFEKILYWPVPLNPRGVIVRGHSSEFEEIPHLTQDAAADRGRQRGLDQARVVLQSFIDEVEEFWQQPAPSGVSSPITPVAVLELVERICRRFHLVARQLRVRHSERATIEVHDEYDVQDLLHGLLRVHFDDIRDEEWMPSYAGGSARVDFLLKDVFIVIETKKTRRGLADKELGDQLLIDIARYQAHPDCRTLVCFVYDPEERIANPAALERDLSTATDRIEVRVVVAPRGT